MPCERLPRQDVAVQLRVLLVRCVERPVRRVVERVRDLVDVAAVEPRDREARLDRAERERSGVLPPADAFLGDGRNALAVDDERRRRVVTLRDPVFAFLVAGPLLALEVDRPVEPADAEALQLRSARARAR